ncbi:PE-PPE domain-containing protein [Mycobacterium sp. B14F4]|uniref:PE-PPE domain-containing protein n=1 Tax=Mycobacterium sp. B14F4 TaxID=3153565 RepID=UPI00325D8AF3
MSSAKYIGRIGSSALALGIGVFRPIGTRMTVSIGAALVVTAMVVPASVSTESPAVKLSADATALIVCGTTCPTPDDSLIESVKNQFVAPTHPGQNIEYVPVTTPQEFWPVTGVFRLLGLALGPQSLFGLDGPAWPDEPWWKLSGLFDRSGDQSLEDGAADLQAAMVENPSDHLVIFGVSQGAGVANVTKRKLAEQYPAGTKAPDVDFVLSGDPNLPNGGLASRFAGLYIPILDLTFNGPAPTNTQFDTVEINRQYDGFSDLPLYPLNVISLTNALLGVVYVHMYLLDVSLPAEPTKSPAYQGKHGDTDYYFFENPDLPLFGPLRTLGVPESLIDVVEPFFRVIVELGYDRSIPAWQPTPARLIPTLDPGKVATDLVNAVGEGVNNAAKLFGLAPPPHDPPPATITQSAPIVQSQSTSTRQTATNEPMTSSEQTVSVTESTSSGQTGTTDQSTSDNQTTGTEDSKPSEQRGTTSASDDADDEAGATDTADRSPVDSPSAGNTSVGGASEDDHHGAANE